MLGIPMRLVENSIKSAVCNIAKYNCDILNTLKVTSLFTNILDEKSLGTIKQRLVVDSLLETKINLLTSFIIKFS